MSLSLNRLRRDAKLLKRHFHAGDADAVARVAAVLPGQQQFRHAEALHVIAREQGYASWPRLKAAIEAATLDRSAKAERLKMALYFGQHWVVDALLAETPDLPGDSFGLQCALYEVDAVSDRLASKPELATRVDGVRRPILHLAFSQHVHGTGSEADMLAVAEALLADGADVDDGYPSEPGSEHRLSALYGAIGHANNMVLGRWLLERGANPNDDESLYHATELGHHDGLKLLLRHGARPEGTNALQRALDFNDEGAVRLLLDAGADPNEGIAPHPSGQPAIIIPSLHQAARRHADGAIAQALLDHGADPNARFDGHTAYALACIHGNSAVADVLRAAGASVDLSTVEDMLARAADDRLRPEDRIDLSALSAELRRLLTRLVWRDGTLDYMRRLVAIGFDPNVTDEMGMPPLHLAAWEGLPEKMAYLLSLDPDLDHLNDYGGTLFSTVLHGSENCPQRADRDHIACMQLALEAGVDLPRRALDVAGDEAMAAFLADWADAHPEQVAETGVA